MRNVFIICEFDPFHLGHEYLLKQARRRFEGCRIVCVLGGNFSQRGEVYLYDKYTRACCAVRCGADIVLLLPDIYSCAAGNVFASGAVKICNGLAECGDILFFGSECGDIVALELCRRRLSEPEFSTLGSPDISFARHRASLYEEKYGKSDILSSPNNILALEYLRVLNETQSVLTPCTVARSPSFASASSLRSGSHELLLNNIPSSCVELCRTSEVARMKYGERYVLGALRSLKPDTVAEFSECSAGVGNRILSAAMKSGSYDELISLVSTKKYPTSRMRRAVVAMLVGITDEMRKKEPCFTVLLAARRSELSLLKNARINVISKRADAVGEAHGLQLKFDALYTLFTERVHPAAEALTRSPYIV